MQIKKSHIVNLRNHNDTSLEYSNKLNIFYGQNGAGKTTVLEGIAVCSYTKSFLQIADISLVKSGENGYQSECEAINDLNLPYNISINYNIGSRKCISSSYGENLNPKDIIGDIPLIVLSPDFKSITIGSPQDRRDFIDRLLSQSSKIYMEDLIKLKKILKQRNSLLTQSKNDRFFDYSVIEPWTELFIKISTDIVYRRKKFIRDFIPYFFNYYETVSNSKEEVSLEYLPSSFNGELNTDEWSKTDIQDVFSKIYKRLFQAELKRGITLFGPQKDELKISINSGVAKEYASQGQHKSLLISIKFAEFEFLKQKRNETPIILLDDIFSELDEFRTEKVFYLLSQNSAQTFITSTEKEKLMTAFPTNDYSFFYIENGKVIIN